MAKIRIATLLRALNLSISVISQRIILFVIFIAYVRGNNKLSAEKVFVVMLIISFVRHKMTWLFPNSVALLYELKVSTRRIQSYLLLDEINQARKDVENLDDVSSVQKNNRVDGNVHHQASAAAASYIKSNRKDGQPALTVKSLTARWVMIHALRLMSTV